MEAMVYADVLGTLRDLTNSTYLHSFSVDQDSSASFNYSGTLQPSRYILYMSAQADVYPDYNEQFIDAPPRFKSNINWHHREPRFSFRNPNRLFFCFPGLRF